MTVELDAVVAAIRSRRYLWSTEADLQEGVGQALREAGILTRAEVRLAGAGRVDVMVGRIAIEIKVKRGKGTDTLDAVQAQVARYAAHPDVDAVVLVTTRAQHRGLPDEVGGVPVRVVWVSGL